MATVYNCIKISSGEYPNMELQYQVSSQEVGLFLLLLVSVPKDTNYVKAIFIES